MLRLNALLLCLCACGDAGTALPPPDAGSETRVSYDSPLDASAPEARGICLGWGGCPGELPLVVCGDARLALDDVLVCP
jgi:hypothetical protein